MEQISQTQAFYIGCIFNCMQRYYCPPNIPWLMHLCGVKIKTQEFMDDLATCWALMYGCAPADC